MVFQSPVFHGGVVGGFFLLSLFWGIFQSAFPTSAAS